MASLQFRQRMIHALERLPNFVIRGLIINQPADGRVLAGCRADLSLKVGDFFYHRVIDLFALDELAELAPSRFNVAEQAVHTR